MAHTFIVPTEHANGAADNFYIIRFGTVVGGYETQLEAQEWLLENVRNEVLGHFPDAKCLQAAELYSIVLTDGYAALVTEPSEWFAWTQAADELLLRHIK